MTLADIVRSNFKTPLELTVDRYSCIAVAKYDYSSTYPVGLVLLHEGRRLDTGRALPTYREFLGVVGLHAREDSEEIAEIAAEWFDDEPWLDALGVNAGEADRVAALAGWLELQMDMGSDFALDWILERIVTEHTPGLDIAHQFSRPELQALGLELVDLGGPVSSLPAVRFRGSIDELNQIIARTSLPFVAIGAPASGRPSPVANSRQRMRTSRR